jgi:Carboxypeptidase regulatory-like domain
MTISPILHRVLAVLVLATLLAGCGDSPSEPEHSASPELHVSCLPLGVSVSCKATLTNVPGRGSEDVTPAATWISFDSGVGDFLEPGVFTPRRRGEVEISASYQSWTTHVTSSFLVDPLQPAQRLYFLAGLVRDEVSNALLPGVTVEILDGYARGLQSVTNENGHYKIDRLLTGETFSVKAIKAGYESSTLTYRVDSPVGPAGSNPPFLDFRLRRSE